MEIPLKATKRESHTVGDRKCRAMHGAIRKRKPIRTKACLATYAEIEPEPEVDLSKLHAKVAALDMSAKPQYDVASDDEEPAWEEQDTTRQPMSSDDVLQMLQEKSAAEENRGMSMTDPALKARLGAAPTSKPYAAAWRRTRGANPSKPPTQAPSKENPVDGKNSLDIDEFLASVDHPAATASGHNDTQKDEMERYLDDLLE